MNPLAVLNHRIEKLRTSPPFGGILCVAFMLGVLPGVLHGQGFGGQQIDTARADRAVVRYLDTLRLIHTTGLIPGIIDTTAGEWFDGVLVFRAIEGFESSRFHYVIYESDSAMFVLYDQDREQYWEFVRDKFLAEPSLISWDQIVDGYIRYVLDMKKEDVLDSVTLRSLLKEGDFCRFDFRKKYSYDQAYPYTYRFFSVYEGWLMAHYIEYYHNWGFRYSQIPLFEVDGTK